LAQNNARLPKEGSIIASSRTSPIDALYLAAIFDPIFTASYPDTRKVEHISLFKAILRPFVYPRVTPPPRAKLISLEALGKQFPSRVIVVFPECTTSNGRGILPFGPSLLSASPRTKVFPVSLRYAPQDITTPIPHSYLTFLWNLCAKSTHTIRIRIAEAAYNTSRRSEPLPARATGYSKNTLDNLLSDSSASDADPSEGLDASEKAFLDKIAEALARLGRVQRVGLGVRDKGNFVAMWTKSKRRWWW